MEHTKGLTWLKMGEDLFFSQPFPVTFTITQKEGLLPISFVKAFHRDLAKSYISFFCSKG